MATKIPAISGILYVRFPVSDPAASRDFYRRALGFQEERNAMEEGQLLAVALTDPQTGIRYVLRRDAERAGALRDFDLLAFAVPTHAELDAWAAYLDEQGIEHGPMDQGSIGRQISLQDPDGNILRLYCLEESDAK